jgi:hypothetical protein
MRSRLSLRTGVINQIRVPASSKAETLAPATGGALIAFLALGDEKQNHAADGCGYGGHEPPIDTFAFEKLKAQQQRHQRIGGNQRRYKRDRPAAESGIHRKNGGAVAQSNGCEPQRAAAVEFVFGRTARHERRQD